MNGLRVSVRSVVHHRRAYAVAALGVAVATAIIVGAAVVGDSVRSALTGESRARLGKSEIAVIAPRPVIGESLPTRLSQEVDAAAAPYLELVGVASADGGRRIAHRVQVLGVDSRFLEMVASRGGLGPIAGLWMNEPCAHHLGVSIGEPVVLRFDQPTGLSLGAPFAPTIRHESALALPLEGIVGAGSFGRFSLRAEAVDPLTIFLPMDVLQSMAGAEGKVNRILLDGSDPDRVEGALVRTRRFEDTGLRWRETIGGEVELVSSSVFLGPSVERAVATFDDGTPLVTWLAESIQGPRGEAHYSFVTGVEGEAGFSPGGLPIPKPGEIILHTDLAEQIGLLVGDTTVVHWPVPSVGGQVTTRTTVFTVAALLPTVGPWMDPGLMPDFPGVVGMENCSDWDPGFAVDLAQITPEDESYWDRHGGTPRAFVAGSDIRSALDNPFGVLTAVRWPHQRREVAESQVLEKMMSMGSGWTVVDVGAGARRSIEDGQNFGALFLGMGSLLVIAALWLLWLFQSHLLERRAGEWSIMNRIGFTRARVRRWQILDAVPVSLAGAFGGAALGIGYAWWVIGALGEPLLGGGLHLDTAVSPVSLAWGGVVGSILGIAVPLLHRARDFRPPGVPLALALMGLGVGWAILGPGAPETKFFVSGGLVLVGSTRLIASRIFRPENGACGTSIWWPPGRPGSSFAMMSVMGLGVFLVLSVWGYRPSMNHAGPSGPTGGFDFYVRTARPLPVDPGSPGGIDRVGIDAGVMGETQVLGLRIVEGDDASCLNPLRAQRPQLLGLDPTVLAARNSFTTGQAMVGESAWDALRHPGDFVPGVVDHTTLVWGLGMELGDIIEFVDDFGDVMAVELVAWIEDSVLQGSILVDSDVIARRFPLRGGHRGLLVDGLDPALPEIRREIDRALLDLGPETWSTFDYMDRYHGVERTYISIFLFLGGVALLFATLGTGVLVLRASQDRRHEYATMRAMGFPPRQLRRILVREHDVLLAIGLLAGGGAAGIALLPSEGGIAFVGVLAVAMVLALHGMIWIRVAAYVATRGLGLDILKEDP